MFNPFVPDSECCSMKSPKDNAFTVTVRGIDLQSLNVEELEAIIKYANEIRGKELRSYRKNQVHARIINEFFLKYKSLFIKTKAAIDEYDAFNEVIEKKILELTEKIDVLKKEVYEKVKAEKIDEALIPIQYRIEQPKIDKNKSVQIQISVESVKEAIKETIGNSVGSSVPIITIQLQNDLNNKKITESMVTSVIRSHPDVFDCDKIGKLPRWFIK